MSEPSVHLPPLIPVVKIHWGLACIAAVTMVVGLLLGNWQLNRAAEKNALANQISDKNKAPAFINNALTAMLNIALGVPDPSSAAPSMAQTLEPSLAPLINRRAQLQGRWLHEHTVYLQNRQMNRLQGFYVVTPLRLQTEGGAAANPYQGSVILVQRGWVARDFMDMQKLPPVGRAEGLVEIEGRLIAQTSTAYALDAALNTQASTPPSKQSNTQISAATHPASPQKSTQTAPENSPAAAGAPGVMRQNLGVAAFAAQTGLPTLPLVLLQTGADSEGLQRAWPAVDAGVDKHYGYAFQWFALAALVLFLFIWFQFIAPKRRAKRSLQIRLEPTESP